jgi:hypothetical protein
MKSPPPQKNANFPVQGMSDPQHQSSISSRITPIPEEPSGVFHENLEGRQLLNVQVKLNQYPFPPGWTQPLDITRGDFYSFKISGPHADQLNLGIEVIPQFSRMEITRKTHMTASEIPPPPFEALVANLSVTAMEAQPQNIPASPRRLLQEEFHCSGPFPV